MIQSHLHFCRQQKLTTNTILVSRYVCTNDNLQYKCIHTTVDNVLCHWYSGMGCLHDNVIKWNHFRVTGPLCGEFHLPSQRPVTPIFDVFVDLSLNKRLSKQSRRWWFETPSCSLLRDCNELTKWLAVKSQKTSLTVDNQEQWYNWFRCREYLIIYS